MSILNKLRKGKNNSCQRCGWNKIHPATGVVPLYPYYKDGNCLNIEGDNVELLCPNCYILTCPPDQDDPIKVSWEEFSNIVKLLK